VLGKHISIRSKLPTSACWSREKREECVKPQATHSQHSLPAEALNLIVESKSLSIEINNSTIELHLPVEGKEKLAIMFCGF